MHKWLTKKIVCSNDNKTNMLVNSFDTALKFISTMKRLLLELRLLPKKLILLLVFTYLKGSRPKNELTFLADMSDKALSSPPPPLCLNGHVSKN